MSTRQFQVGEHPHLDIRVTSGRLTLVEGEAMEVRIAAARRKLTPGTTLQVSV